MDILKKTNDILEKVANIRQEYNKLSNILEYPEIYSDKKYSLYLTSSKQKIEKIVKIAQDLEDAVALCATEQEISALISALERELVIHEADSVLSCVIEFVGDDICIEIVKQSIDEQIKNNHFTVYKEDKWIISGLGAYSSFVDSCSGSCFISGVGFSSTTSSSFSPSISSSSS